MARGGGSAVPGGSGARWERCPVAPQCLPGRCRCSSVSVVLVSVAPGCLSGRFQWLPGACHAGAGGSPVSIGQVPALPGAQWERCRRSLVPVTPVPPGGVGRSRCRGAAPAVPGAAGRCRPSPVPAVPGAAGRCRRFPVPAVPGVGRSRCRRAVPAVPGAAGRCRRFPVPAVPGVGRSRCRRAVLAVPGAGRSRCRPFPVPPGGVGRSRCRPFPVPPGGVPGRPRRVRMRGAAGPIGRRSHMAAGRRRGCRSSLPPSILPPSLLPWPGWRWERPRSHHEHPQGLQHLGDRLPGDQIPTERGNPNPGREEHQVRAGGYLAGQRSPGGDEGQGGQPQSHPTPDRQRGPVLRGLRALRGSCGAKHSAGVPEVGLSPASPPSLDSTCIPERPPLRPPSPAGCQRCPGTTTWVPAQGKTHDQNSSLQLPPSCLTPASSRRDPKKATLAAWAVSRAGPGSRQLPVPLSTAKPLGLWEVILAFSPLLCLAREGLRAARYFPLLPAAVKIVNSAASLPFFFFFLVFFPPSSSQLQRLWQLRVFLLLFFGFFVLI